MTRRAITSIAILWAASTLPGCTVDITGSALPSSDSVGNTVEWVTDPESDSKGILAVTIRGDGEFLVGADFPPGIYTSEGSRPGSVCAWQRISRDRLGSRTVVGAGSSRDQQTLAVLPTDSIFATWSCKPWRMLS